MSTQLVRHRTPEEEELDKKLVELAQLESEISERELDLATIQAQLRTFEALYVRIVGSRYAELDEIEAQIAEAQARLNPKNQQAQEQAERARTQARETAYATDEVRQQERPEKFEASEGLRRLYREVAKQVHPDLSTDPAERTRRERLMAEANRAYAEGDATRLERILAEWEGSPESVKGEGIGVELVRVIRKIAQVRTRISAIQADITRLQESDLYQLRLKASQAEREGRDLLAEMAARLDRQLDEARERLKKVLSRGAR